jgi:hypothetical protein
MSTAVLTNRLEFDSVAATALLTRDIWPSLQTCQLTLHLESASENRFSRCCFR